MQFNITNSVDGGRAICSIVANGQIHTTDSDNPNWVRIVALCMSDGDPAEIQQLMSLEHAVASKFNETLTERVAVLDGVVTFDNDPISPALSKQIVRFVNEDVDDWKPLVKFLENVMANPVEHSREQLFEWLQNHDFSISDDGCFFAYKGLNASMGSIHSGPGVVNGEHVNGHLDNSVGNVIEMARSTVQADPGVGCGTGLHAGTYSYASSFGQKVVRVKVNPRDVVSVPTDCAAQKIRCCRYEVVEEVEVEYNPPVYGWNDDPDELDWDNDWDDFDEDWDYWENEGGRSY